MAEKPPWLCFSSTPVAGSPDPKLLKRARPPPSVYFSKLWTISSSKISSHSVLFLLVSITGGVVGFLPETCEVDERLMWRAPPRSRHLLLADRVSPVRRRAEQCHWVAHVVAGLQLDEGG